jgi:hypothetical protein
MSQCKADLRSPYQWFGGKRKIAKEVWTRFGEVRNFVEPFFGSGAVLLARPQPFEGTETINDLNAWVTNFWRSLAADPEAVAFHADWPVSELDTHARGDAIFYGDDWYAARGHVSVDAWIEWLRGDTAHYDAQIAGWWVWGQCCWIGDNWGRGSHSAKRDEGGNPIAVTKALPHLGNAGRGVNRKLPHLGAGRGVNRKLPHLGAGRGGATGTTRGAELLEYMRGLAERMRRVRICCGDWSRVCGPTPTSELGLTAVFLDPPYAVADRDAVYGEHDSRNVANDVREWAIAHGDDPLMRIALCGYEGEHVMPDDWDCFAWKAQGGYGVQAKDGNENCKRERIWFSPQCQRGNTLPLFKDLAQEESR